MILVVTVTRQRVESDWPVYKDGFVGTVSGPPSFTVSPLRTGPAIDGRNLADRGIIEFEPFAKVQDIGAGRNRHMWGEIGGHSNKSLDHFSNPLFGRASI